ncbi:cytochrome b ascorbate-dependent protein 3 [Podospora aff. communis PSN243]|uniref:Cytochrome b ascorbate-dependent protein 3 n=1 Tax=Podospora aff. communis PSN243 TaxID=3040156 RepID=A0AAV9H3N7_9PEZI|nr:cytochrome b ascorbate-dependent protein 3 [Podospora aff. communis PSN243]
MSSPRQRATPSADPPPPVESEPLLGRPGDAIQKPNASLISNLWLGTGWLALCGLVLLAALIYSALITHPKYTLLTPHPSLQTLGTISLTLAILVLQPTATPEAKAQGQKAHAVLQLLALLLFTAGIAVIETNKHVNKLEHFHSVHGYLGTLTGVLFLGQYALGVMMWATPRVLGGEAKAKSLWKYHRWGGYGLLLSLLATLVSAAETDYVKKVLGVKTWAVAIAVGLVVAGTFPRIQVRKLGIHRQ